MLYQLHWQFKDDRTEMKAERDINSREEATAFLRDAQVEYPLPDGVVWLMVSEDSVRFVRAA